MELAHFCVEILNGFLYLMRNTATVCGVLPYGCEQAFGSLLQIGALANALSQKANGPNACLLPNLGKNFQLPVCTGTLDWIQVY